MARADYQHTSVKNNVLNPEKKGKQEHLYALSVLVAGKDKINWQWRSEERVFGTFILSSFMPERKIFSINLTIVYI